MAEIPLRLKYRRPASNGRYRAPASGHANTKKQKLTPTAVDRELHAKQPHKVMIVTASGKRKMIVA